MQEVTNFYFLGMFPEFNRVLSSVSCITENDWAAYKQRKNMGGIAGGNTDTIPLIYDTRDTLSSQYKHQMFTDFSETISTIGFMYSRKFVPVSAARAFLARMAPNSEIKRHKDVGSISAKTHRVHLPIVTNTQCFFTVSDETRHLMAGELWLIDNTDKYHSVVNNGQEFRTHLIVDLINI